MNEETVEEAIDRIEQQQRNLAEALAGQVMLLQRQLDEIKNTLAAHQINPPDARFPHAGNAEQSGQYGAPQ